MSLRNVKKLTAVGIATGLLALASCAPTMTGEYSDPNKVKILDDKWNPSDAQKTLERMLTSCLGRPWLANFVKGHGGRKPTVIVQDMENRTDEHIDTVALTEIMETEYTNSGKVVFIEKARRGQVMDEQEFQNSGAVSEASRKKTGNMTGADFMLVGSITNQIHTQDKVKQTTYQVQMKLVNIETSEIAWTETSALQKEFKSNGAKW